MYSNWWITYSWKWEKIQLWMNEKESSQRTEVCNNNFWWPQQHKGEAENVPNQISLFWLSRWDQKGPALFLDRPVPFHGMTLAREELQFFYKLCPGHQGLVSPTDCGSLVSPSHLSWPRDFKGHFLPRINSALGGLLVRRTSMQVSVQAVEDGAACSTPCTAISTPCSNAEQNGD